ncbi:hypothetical protein CFC21_028539 [Triticum aestivum]|uniref:Peroxidase n=2 Tax=Triticum aestivum TaxID=4565 RepID=A0A3B6D8R0_WHEAT|nr:peroxidase 2-like [Triticum aestivum]KAF7014556.1 hypothetical protein CFC21_028539 [Triticum aestivum]
MEASFSTSAPTGFFSDEPYFTSIGYSPTEPCSYPGVSHPQSHHAGAPTGFHPCPASTCHGLKESRSATTTTSALTPRRSCWTPCATPPPASRPGSSASSSTTALSRVAMPLSAEQGRWQAGSGDARIPNLSLRGFEVIDATKKKIEEKCPGVVSCADIVAFAGRDASKILSGNKINFSMPAGRYDGSVSLKDETLPNLPPPFANLNTLTQMFAKKGLSQTEMVALSGAHSIGRSQCSSFRHRHQPPANDNSTTSMDATYAGKLTQDCPAGSDPTVPQDYKTPDVLDSQYYRNMKDRKVLFTSDAALMTSPKTKELVEKYTWWLIGDFLWYRHFEDAMVNMGNIEVKSSTNGQIRNKCGFVNEPYTG